MRASHCQTEYAPPPSRRDILALASWSLLGGGLVHAVEACREHKSRLSPQDREYLRGIHGKNLEWVEVPSEQRGGRTFVARHEDGARIAIGVHPTGKGTLYVLHVAEVAQQFLYKCTGYGADRRDLRDVHTLLNEAIKGADGARKAIRCPQFA